MTRLDDASTKHLRASGILSFSGVGAEAGAGTGSESVGRGLGFGIGLGVTCGAGGGHFRRIHGRRVGGAQLISEVSCCRGFHVGTDAQTICQMTVEASYQMHPAPLESLVVAHVASLPKTVPLDMSAMHRHRIVHRSSLRRQYSYLSLARWKVLRRWRR